ncbi:hypothetical protein SLA2020_277290 [Shorea laevis]
MFLIFTGLDYHVTPSAFRPLLWITTFTFLQLFFNLPIRTSNTPTPSCNDQIPRRVKGMAPDLSLSMKCEEPTIPLKQLADQGSCLS